MAATTKAYVGGDNTTGEQRSGPGAATSTAAIAGGTDHVVALTRDGDVVAWGRNHRGQLGLGHRRDQLRPVVSCVFSAGHTVLGS